MGHCVCVGRSDSLRVCVRCLQMHHRYKTTSLHASTKTSYFLPFSHNQTQLLLLPPSQHAAISELMKTCCSLLLQHAQISQLLTTYTPSVMFYKHILNNSAHPHLPNGLLFPEGAWLLFASTRLSFSSCLSLFLRLLSPLLLLLLYICCGLLCLIDASCTLNVAFRPALGLFLTLFYFIFGNHFGSVALFVCFLFKRLVQPYLTSSITDTEKSCGELISGRCMNVCEMRRKLKMLHCSLETFPQYVIVLLFNSAVWVCLQLEANMLNVFLCV